MNILSIINLFTFGIALGDWIMEVLYKILLFFDGVAYTFLTYAYKLFQLMCSLNFNSLYGLVTPIITRIEALVMVFVVYKLGISLINYMLKPDEAAKKGKEILINIFITAALLISYNTIFGIFNELSMLIIGTPDTYQFTYLGQIADLTETKDAGLINRLVFGADEEMTDIGEYIAFSICSSFITDVNDPRDTSSLEADIVSTSTNAGHPDFMKLPTLASKMAKKYDYFVIVGFVAAMYLIYSLVKTTIQVGVRAFKLLILQILAPIAIITVIGEGLKGKTFKSFINKYVSVYIELFIRMFSILLICTFVVKFIRNLGDYFPTISTDEWYTYALMIVLIIAAAFKFAGDIPKFIDEILSTHLGDDKKGGFGHFMGGLLGAGIGTTAGLIGGFAGGGVGGAIAGAASGLVGGITSGAKGKNVADFFKGQAQVGKNAKTRGQNIAAKGGLFQSALGGVESFVGRGSHFDKRLADLDKQSRALDELEAAEKFAVKDSKMGQLDSEGHLNEFDQEWESTNGALSDTYSSGYNDIKLGEDKDAFAAKMLDYDKTYQQAQATYDSISGTDLSSYRSDISDAERRLAEAQAQLNLATTDEDRAAGEALVQEMTQRRHEAQERLAAQERSIADAKTAAEEARANAEKRAKDYYDARKKYEGDHNKDVQAKRRDYISAGGNNASGDARTAEKRRIHDAKARIKNRHSYQRTHGENPKGK